MKEIFYKYKNCYDILMNKVLMPRGTALWLLRNTKLTVLQISNFCDLDLLTIHSLNDANTSEFNPVEIGQLTLNEIRRCEENKENILKNQLNLEFNTKRNNRKYLSQYTRSQRPFAIAWFIHYYPNVSIEKIAKILHMRQTRVEKYIHEIKLKPEKFTAINPTKYGFCSQKELDEIIES